jgi:hypothetical protein
MIIRNDPDALIIFRVLDVHGVSWPTCPSARCRLATVIRQHDCGVIGRWRTGLRLAAIGDRP